MDLLLYGVPVLAIIMGLVKLARVEGLPSQYAPLLSVALGILCGVAVAYVNGMNYLQGGIFGLVAGLSASGLYDASKFKEVISEVIPVPIETPTNESGFALSAVAIILALICLFIVLIYTLNPAYYTFYYIMAACILVGFFGGLFSRFKYTKNLEKQLIAARLDKI